MKQLSVSLRALSAAAVCAALALLAVHAGLGIDAALGLAPAALLLAVLWARRYPGERLLMRLATRSPHTSRRVARASRPRPCGARRVPRGGLLLAFSLAVRPPPARSVANA